MDQIYPDQGLIDVLNAIVGPDLQYHLFVNDVTPDLDTVLTDLTEAAWSGYVPITVPAGAFSFTSLAEHVGQVTADQIPFPNTSGTDQTVYGYYATYPGGGNLILCARFDGAPIVIPYLTTRLVTPGVANYSSLFS